MDEDLVREALEIAAGGEISSEFGQPRTARPPALGKLRTQLGRFLEDLPGDASIHELRELLEGLD